MKIDLICNTCGFETKGDADMIGDKCPKCDDGSFIQKAEDAEGSSPEKPKGTEKGGETKITKEKYINDLCSKMIEFVQEEDMYEFKKLWNKLIKKNIVEKINEMKIEMMKEYSDEDINEQVDLNSTGVLNDGSQFSVKEISDNNITLLVGGNEMEMSMNDFSSKAKVNSKV